MPGDHTTICSLGGDNLPVQFSYNPYVPMKRRTVKRTATGVVTIASSPQIIHGDGTVSWSLTAAYREEYLLLFNKYNVSSPTTYTFLGYWADSLEVQISVLDPPSIRGRLFDFGGQFQVISVNQHFTSGPC